MNAMNRSRTLLATVLAATALAGALSTGCARSRATGKAGLDAQAPATATGSPAADERRALPYVQAEFEYVVPADRWAGPAPMLFRVTTEQGLDASVTLTSGFLMPELVSLSSDLDGESAPMPSQIVREQLGRIAETVKAEEEDPSRCPGMIRVRLIQADGAVTKRAVCRDRSEGSRLVATTLHQMMRKAVIPFRNLPFTVTQPERYARSGAQESI